MKNWWNNLTDREKQLVALASGVLIVFLFLQLIWQPMLSANKQARQNISNKLETLKWMQPVVSHIMAARAGGSTATKSLSGDSLLGAVERDIRASRLNSSLTQIGVGPNASVHLTFAQVGFDDFMAWLNAANKKLGVSVISFNASKLEKAGLVKLDVNLK